MASDVDHARLLADYDKLRKRQGEAVTAARRKGANEVAAALADIIDDCDRALAALGAAAAPDHWRLGIEQMRDRALERFERIGYEQIHPLGDKFNPQLHEAVAVDSSPGAAGQITAVHRRGWIREGILVLPASVVVRSGSDELARNVERTAYARQQSAGHVVDSVVRRRRRPSAPNFYACPYESPGCHGDCLQCQSDRV